MVSRWCQNGLTLMFYDISWKIITILTCLPKLISLIDISLFIFLLNFEEDPILGAIVKYKRYCNCVEIHYCPLEYLNYVASTFWISGFRYWLLQKTDYASRNIACYINDLPMFNVNALTLVYMIDLSYIASCKNVLNKILYATNSKSG